jgi:hypothetical protein
MASDPMGYQPQTGNMLRDDGTVGNLLDTMEAVVTAGDIVSLTVAEFGAIDDAAETDPDQNATVIALLKGIVTLLVQANATLDDIKADEDLLVAAI